MRAPQLSCVCSDQLEPSLWNEAIEASLLLSLLAYELFEVDALELSIRGKVESYFGENAITGT